MTTTTHDVDGIDFRHPLDCPQGVLGPLDTYVSAKLESEVLDELGEHLLGCMESVSVRMS